MVSNHLWNSFLDYLGHKFQFNDSGNRSGSDALKWLQEGWMDTWIPVVCNTYMILLSAHDFLMRTIEGIFTLMFSSKVKIYPRFPQRWGVQCIQCSANLCSLFLFLKESAWRKSPASCAQSLFILELKEHYL